MARPASPYGQCNACYYIGTDVAIDVACPHCGTNHDRSCGVWPTPEFVELWDDLVFAWNDERAELAAVVAAMYFEASVFDLIGWGAKWLDPELNWIGAELNEIREKSARISEYLARVRSRKAATHAVRRLFGTTLRDMLCTVLRPDDEEFWANYRRLADIRNAIVHKGTRIWCRTVDAQQAMGARDQVLLASVHFVPRCWVVFSRLWNVYVHKPMLANSRSVGAG